MELRVNEINTYFDDLMQVHIEKERYNIEWAFEDAQKKMDAFKHEIIDDRLKGKCKLCKNSEAVLKDFHGLQKTSKGIVKRNKWYARLFSNMYSVLSVVEILISFLLVMGLSEISHSGAEFFDSRTFSFAFAATFAFLKVIIERYWVSPAIEKWGWKLYEKSIVRLREKTLEINFEASKLQDKRRDDVFASFATEAFQVAEEMDNSLIA